jgi:hypothetical protein
MFLMFIANTYAKLSYEENIKSPRILFLNNFRRHCLAYKTYWTLQRNDRKDTKCEP